MALSATVLRVQLDISNIDESVYERLELRVAQHPSEDQARVVVRLLARALAHEEGLEFGRGLSHTEDPALWARSPVGEIKTWVDVGVPSADRLHRASKKADQVLVFTDKTQAALMKEWTSRAIHRAEQIRIVQLPTKLVASLAGSLSRSVEWFITLNEGQLSVGDGTQSWDGTVSRQSLAEFLED